MSCASCFNFQNLYIYLNNLHLRPHCLIVCLNVYHFRPVFYDMVLFHFVLHTYTQTDSLSFALYYTHTHTQTLSLSLSLSTRAPVSHIKIAPINLAPPLGVHGPPGV